MAFSVQMPALGESVTEGTVTRWLKQEGDRVEVDEPLLEVSTDKVDTEIPSPVAGTLLEITASEDETIDVKHAMFLRVCPPPWGRQRGAGTKTPSLFRIESSGAPWKARASRAASRRTM